MLHTEKEYPKSAKYLAQHQKQIIIHKIKVLKSMSEKNNFKGEGILKSSDARRYKTDTHGLPTVFVKTRL
jgi:hypothetical protein